MGFFSFSKKHYQEKLEYFENKTVSSEDIYEAKQLLKIIEDNFDEGYTDLYYQMENEFSGISRLRKFITSNNDVPFTIDHYDMPKTSYNSNEYELTEVLDNLIETAKHKDNVSDNPFLNDIISFCEFIEYQEDTAYIFLLRDTLLPYTYFKSRNRKNIYGYLISRASITDLTNAKDVDDDIRIPIFEALESNYVEYYDVCNFCKGKILEALNNYPKLKNALIEMLNTIKCKKIVVVESGYCGTIPMLLKSLDERVSFKMYTTAPYLFETYKDNIFCKRYEDVRKFETLYSQDLYLQYSSYRNGKFYVKVSNDENIKENALLEISKFVKK